jgi:hypothetical protein
VPIEKDATSRMSRNTSHCPASLSSSSSFPTRKAKPVNAAMQMNCAMELQRKLAQNHALSPILATAEDLTQHRRHFEMF